MTYYINGWQERKNYFFSIGNFTPDELKMLNNSQSVEKNGNCFWVDDTNEIEEALEEIRF